MDPSDQQPQQNSIKSRSSDLFESLLTSAFGSGQPPLPLSPRLVCCLSKNMYVHAAHPSYHELGVTSVNIAINISVPCVYTVQVGSYIVVDLLLLASLVFPVQLVAFKLGPLHALLPLAH